jgi:uncharacterized protein YxeA
MKKILTISLIALVFVGGIFFYISSVDKNSKEKNTDENFSLIKTKIENVSRMETASQDLNQIYTNYSQKGAAAAELLKEPSLNKEDKAYLLLTQASGLLEGAPNSLEAERKNKTLEAYGILYSLAQNPEFAPHYRGAALLGIKQAAYLSGSEDWFLEAVKKYDPETYSFIKDTETLEKKILSVKIEYGKKATALVLSPFNEIELASDIMELSLLEKDSAKRTQALTLAENLYKTWSSRTEPVSGYYDGRNLSTARSLEYKTRYLIALSKIKKDPLIQNELSAFVPSALLRLESATLQENPNRARFVSAAFIRVWYASYLYETYRTKKSREIKEILAPLYEAPKENIPGFLFYVKTHENKTSFSSLKKIASFDENFKRFLTDMGWKI